MNQVQELENLKTIKRSVKFSYQFLRTYYIDKINISSKEEKEIYASAITALDEMYRLYESLKFKMRKSGISDQIEFAKKLEEYINCIESLTFAELNKSKSYENLEVKNFRKNAFFLFKNYKELSRQFAAN